MAASADPSRVAALRTAARLPPLPLAVVELADSTLRDLVSELAEECMHKAAQTVPCDASVRTLLEGAAGTLPGDGSTISKALHKLLTEEVSQTARCAKRSRDALGPAIAGGHCIAVHLHVFF